MNIDISPPGIHGLACKKKASQISLRKLCVSYCSLKPTYFCQACIHNQNWRLFLMLVIESRKYDSIFSWKDLCRFVCLGDQGCLNLIWNRHEKHMLYMKHVLGLYFYSDQIVYINYTELLNALWFRFFAFYLVIVDSTHWECYYYNRTEKHMENISCQLWIKSDWQGLRFFWPLPNIIISIWYLPSQTINIQAC